MLADHARGVACMVLDHLSAMFGLNQTLNKLRHQVNELSRQNAILAGQVDQLETVQQRLAETESKLRQLSVLHGQSVDVLVAQVQEFRKIQAKMEDNLQAKVIQNLISVVLTADLDQDFLIDPEEIDHLEFRLKCIDGVDFSETNFRKALAESGPNTINVREGGFSIKAVLAVIKNLMDESVPEDENIFNLHPEKLALS